MKYSNIAPMGLIRSKIVVFSVVLLSFSLILSCSQPESSNNGLLPRLPENDNKVSNTSDNKNDNSRASATPSVKPTESPNTSSFEDCECELSDCSRQMCTFPLDGYEAGNYNHSSTELDRFINKVVSFIQETELTRGCEVLAITSWGYADALVLKSKSLKWTDVPDACKKNLAEFAYLRNDDLAQVRECLVKNLISSRLGGSIDITAKNWRSDWEAYNGSRFIGPDFRKVVIKIERIGTCQ